MSGAPGMPSPEELGEQRQALAGLLMVLNEQMSPILDAADGMKASMEARGWSPTAAEQVALAWLLSAMSTAMGGGAGA